ncbi:chromate transport protein [Marvinbryantia formatexigens DSM 14469]|uniref:Chromate transport protein n=2 Tax=Marvinbryantia TaxID=248744 RepID=C6LB39_9FIRM|nr:chromate transport protein [Marvinbryantia formatexigens DSM 14469]
MLLSILCATPGALHYIIEEEQKMKELANLFMVFFRIGAFTFGGGYAMLPMLQREVVEKYHWATEDELMDYFAIGQCTPGIIAINTATFVGYKNRGVIGAIAATLGMITPSIIIITLIAAFLTNFADLAVVKHAFNGIRACVCVLIFNAVTKLAKKSVVDNICLGICIAVLLLSLFTPLSPALIVVLAGAAGVLFKRTGIAGGAKK